MDSAIVEVPSGDLAMSYIFYPSPTPVFPVLPPLAWSVHKKPIGASRTTTGATGRENQVACAAYPRWAFTLTYAGNSWLREQTQNITTDPTLAGFTELEQLTSLFLACNGPYGEFYYDDPDDDSRLNQFVGISNLGETSQTYPLTYTWGTGPFNPGLTIPVGGINTLDTVYLDDIPLSPSVYTLDATRTQLTLIGHVGNGTVTVDFHFYFRCRFLDDHLAISQFDRNLWEVKEVRFESVKP